MNPGTPRTVACLCLGAILATAAHSAERPIELRPGDGRELVQAICTSCHSLDYVLINSSFLSLEQWRTSVTKMRTTFGAPVSEEDAETVVRYLASRYGRPLP